MSRVKTAVIENPKPTIIGRLRSLMLNLTP
jgi:hypothetical protein